MNSLPFLLWRRLLANQMQFGVRGFILIDILVLTFHPCIKDNPQTKYVQPTEMGEVKLLNCFT